ncbi:hypothetical protein KR215_009474, partial [Drosophila sulfurigaster]
MAEGLVDRAERWFRTSGLSAVPWSEFRKEFLGFFLPTRYFERLEDNIRDRKQRENESFKDYVTEIRFLMHHADYSKTQELDRIYDNARPEYQYYARRHEITSLHQLIQLATEFEYIQDRIQ